MLKLNSFVAATLSTLALTTVAIGLSGHAQAQTFVGNSSGTWGAPDPGTTSNPVFSGVRTNTFTWGQGTPSK